MNINRQTKLWALCHISGMALSASLGACTTVPDDGAIYTLCEPTPPATACGDDVDIQVK